MDVKTIKSGSTEERELKGVSVSETKLKLNTTDINQVIGEGVIFSSRYLFKVIATQSGSGRHSYH